jgi:hypothetical protein
MWYWYASHAAPHFAYGGTVATPGLQNPQATTARFLFWELEFSVAVLTLAGAAAGVILAESFRFANRCALGSRAEAPDLRPKGMGRPHEAAPGIGE